MPKPSLFSLVLVVTLLLTACQPVTPPAQSGSAGKMAEINGIKLYYEIHGEGAPLILLHLAFGNSGYWMNQIPVFAERYQVIAIDSRGHGRSTFDEQPINYALMASDVIALMDYLQIERANLVGWSDGGIIGLYMAIHHPERLNKVVAYGANYNPSGLNPDIDTNARVNAFIEQAAGDYQKLAADPTQWDAFLANIGNMLATEPNYSAEELGSITTPILVLDGEEEEAILTAHAVEMQGLIPGSELHLIPGTGHFAMWDKPDEVNQIVLEYLAK
jgi:pimeloyl-ACP methyl ester carboxylesterase